MNFKQINYNILLAFLLRPRATFLRTFNPPFTCKKDSKKFGKKFDNTPIIFENHNIDLKINLRMSLPLFLHLQVLASKMNVKDIDI